MLGPLKGIVDQTKEVLGAPDLSPRELDHGQDEMIVGGVTFNE